RGRPTGGSCRRTPSCSCTRTARPRQRRGRRGTPTSPGGAVPRPPSSARSRRFAAGTGPCVSRRVGGSPCGNTLTPARVQVEAQRKETDDQARKIGRAAGRERGEGK